MLGAHKDLMPTMLRAGVYDVVLHYLKAVEALKRGSDDALVLARKKKGMAKVGYRPRNATVFPLRIDGGGGELK
jgi:hypothetical protein